VNPAVTRSLDHWYTYTDPITAETVTVPGSTNILKVLDKSEALMAWAANNTAEAATELARHRVSDAYSALDVLLAVVGPEGVQKALTTRSGWKRDTAAAFGSAIHGWADKLITVGLSVDDLAGMDPATVKRVNVYAEWWKASGWKLRLSEAMVIAPSTGYGGTFDLLAYDADGRTVLCDLKTGSNVYREAILQLCSYGMAPLVQPAGSDTVYPMPVPDRYVVLHVMATKVKEIEVSVGEAERMAFLDCIDLHRWLAKTAGRL
jgi:hypothetical protein